MAKKTQMSAEKTTDENLSQTAQPAPETPQKQEGTSEQTQEEISAQEKNSEQKQAERAVQNPPGPDPSKETLLMQFKDGSIYVLSGIERNDDDTIKLIRCKPSLKNHPAFYEIRNSRKLSATIMEYNRQFKDWKNDVPRYYRIPFTKVPELTMALSALAQDPQNVEAQAIQKRYATSPFALEKIVFDQNRMPVELLAKAGFDVAEMKATGAFKQMENGQFTKNLYTRTEKVDGMKIEGSYAIRAVHDGEDGISFEAMTPQSMESLKNDPLVVELDEKTRLELLGGKTLPYSLRRDNVACFVGVNRTLNRLMYVPCEDYPAPSSIYGVSADQVQRQALARGERVYFRDCSSKDDDPDNHYNGYGQFDINKMEYAIMEKNYEYPHLPKAVKEQMTAQQLKTVFEDNGYINGSTIRKQNGEPLLYMIGINPVTNDIQYISFARYQQAEIEALRTGVSVKDVLNKGERRQSQEQGPDIANKRKAMSM